MLAFIIFFAKIQYLLEVCQGKRSHSIFHANLECIIHILILSLHHVYIIVSILLPVKDNFLLFVCCKGK